MKTLIRRFLPARVVHWLRGTSYRTLTAAHRLRWAAFTYRQGTTGVGTFDGYNVAYRIGSNDAAVLRRSFDTDIFLPAIPEYSLPADAVVLDVGAHIGTFSLLAATKAPHGHVFAIEACRETCELLRNNLSMNRLRNVTVDHLALTDRIGMVKLHHNLRLNVGHSITSQLTSVNEAVSSTTLTQYLEDRSIRHLDLVKLNCEGAEFSIILSTKEEVLRRIDKMIILYHCDRVKNADVSLLIGHLAASGCETRLINRSAERGWIIATRCPGLSPSKAGVGGNC